MRTSVRSTTITSSKSSLNHWRARKTRARRSMAVLICCGLVCGIVAQPGYATVTSEGIVLLSPDPNGGGFYADNPFTTTVNEGIPTAGNSINENQGMNQTNFEGRPDTKGTATLADDENVNYDVFVGYTAYGLLLINGGSEVRGMNMTIGSAAVPPGSGSNVPRPGSGFVRIENPGSVYNNNPDILPFPFFLTGVSPSINPRIDEPGAVDGFDLFVGESALGELSISLGGRAEIQDAVIVGDQSSGSGTLLIDGIGSFLQSGGFQTDNNDPEIINYMIVGRLGTGTMSILNGGQSFNMGVTPDTGGGGQSVFGAVIGSNLAAVNAAAPSAGGVGTVYVDGIASKWTIGGNLQLGGFHNNQLINGDEDLEGNAAVYGSGVGQGKLTVSNGALVSVVAPPLETNGNNAPNRLDIYVGKEGRIELETGGRIELIGALDGQTTPQNPTQEVIRGRLINDGYVGGDGSVTTLQLRNRVLGRIQVNADEKLRFTATGAYDEVDNVPLPDELEYPLSNYGVVDVFGTETARAEIEFVRDVVSPDVDTATNFTRPFLNLPIPAAEQLAPNGRTEGLIHGEYSTMKFKSGLWNRGVLAWTKGNNVVSGDVISFGDSAPMANDHGRVVIGPDTNVAFEDDFFTFGTTQISPGSSFQVLKGNSFAVGGDFSISVQGSSSGMSFDPFQITGNASFSGNLNVNFLNGSAIPPFSSVPIFNVGGAITGNFAQVTPAGLPFGAPIDFFTFVFGNQLYLAAFTIPPTPTPGSPSADLNGDGFVDNLDYAIWVQNFGTSGPAGDADGDGDVDASDYTIWRDQCCGPFPGAGSGSGGLAGGIPGTVPEPTSAVLLACSVLALAFGRRRSA
jgi:hypothetical protein